METIPVLGSPSERLRLALHAFTPWQLAAIGILVGFALILLGQRYMHPLSQYNGPVLASLTNLWRAHSMFRGHFEQDLLALHEKYGAVVRVGPGSLSISHVDVTRVVWGEGSKVIKSPFYDGFTAVRPNMFGMRDEQLHTERKRMLAQTFSRKNILQMEAVMDEHMALLRQTLDEHAASRTPIDLQKWIKLWIFDVLGILIFNRSFEALATGDSGKLPDNDAHVRIALASGLVPWTIQYVKWLPHVPLRKIQDMYRGRQALKQMAEDCVSGVFQTKSQDNTLMLALFAAEDEQTGQKLDRADIISEAFGFLNAGSGTTFATLTVLLWHLLSNPTKLANLVAALDDQLPPGPDPQTVYKADDCAAIPYLMACHKEAARIYPIFIPPLARIVPPEGRTFGPHFVPGGTEVLTLPYLVGNNKDIWGPDVDQFRPERWLAGDSSRLNRYWLPFGVGHRSCLGKNLAETEILKVVATLLRNYEFAMLEPAPGKPFRECITSVGAVELTGPLLVEVKKRPVSLAQGPKGPPS